MFGVVLGVVSLFGGFLWFVWVLFWYRIATEWLLYCLKGWWGWFPGVSRVPFVEWGVGAVWMADVGMGEAGADHPFRVRELARVVLFQFGVGLYSFVLE